MKWTADQITSSGLLVLAGLMPWGMYTLGVIGVSWLLSSIYLLIREPVGLPRAKHIDKPKKSIFRAGTTITIFGTPKN